MKNLFLICAVMLSLYTNLAAQHYSVVSSEYKTWFTNSRGYLRGMKVDSVKAINGNTVYYPFLTARLNYPDNSAYADTTGGSWWGRQIIEQPGGITYFQNYNGDTVLINNAANPGDTWIFFRDTSSVHYTAEVLSVDTQMIGTNVDSVKRIRLMARDLNNAIVADTINGIELRLSKTYGLVTAIDFYLFPYRRFMITPFFEVDCYFYESAGQMNHADKDKLLFNYVDFKMPDKVQIYNYDTGLVYHSWSSISYPLSNVSQSESVKNLIRTRTDTDTGIIYTYDFWRALRVSPGNAPPATSYDSGFARTLIVKEELLWDTTYMPEQWYSGKYGGVYQYYFPDDSSFCLVSPRYEFTTDRIIDNLFHGGGPEPSFPAAKYKEGVGAILLTNGNGHPDGQNRSSGIQGLGTLAGACNELKGPVPVREIELNKIQWTVYPNPAHTMLYLEGNAVVISSIVLYDLCGKAMITKSNTQAGRAELDISSLGAGIYLLKASVKGSSVTRKVVIVH